MEQIKTNLNQSLALSQTLCIYYFVMSVDTLTYLGHGAWRVALKLTLNRGEFSDFVEMIIINMGTSVPCSMS